MAEIASPIGSMIRDWRGRRRMTQMELALEAEVSTRHVSYLETGKAKPSREMVNRLCEHLDIPLRERNVLFLAAGYAPAFPERSLQDDGFRAAREAMSRVLRAHEPFPALAVDRHWNLIESNRAMEPFLAGLDSSRFGFPLNVLRATLHPEGLAPRIVNAAQWREHVLLRVRRQLDRSGDPVLIDLLRELASYGLADSGWQGVSNPSDLPLTVPLRLRTDHGVLSFLYTTMVFGSPLDIALEEIAIELFHPLDQRTRDLLEVVGKRDVVSDH